MKSIIMLIVFPTFLFTQEIVITNNGRKVVLNANGTWNYLTEMEDSVVIQKDTLSFLKTNSSKGYLKSETGKYAIWYQDKKWKVSTQRGSEATELALNRIKGDAYAMTICERIPIAFEYLKEIALENARTADPNARIVKEEYRRVNGKILLHLRIEATIKGIQATFLGYYYSSPELTLQFLTYTATALVKNYEQECYELLNGLEIYD